MRKMRNGNTTLNIVEHIITKNFWEYYVTDEDMEDKEIKLCFVMGLENELGGVYMPEIEPNILTRSRKLNMMPAVGWEWVE